MRIQKRTLWFSSKRGFNWILLRITKTLFISQRIQYSHLTNLYLNHLLNSQQTLIDSILVLEYHELNIEYWILWIIQWWKNSSETEIDATKQERSPRTWEQMQRLQRRSHGSKEKVGTFVISLNCWNESPKKSTAIQQFAGYWSHPVIINVMTPWLTYV